MGKAGAGPRQAGIAAPAGLAFAAFLLYNPPMTFPRLKGIIDQAKFRARIWRTLRSGPPFRSRLDRIIIDLTHCCDLSCLDCNRSCGADQAPAEEFFSLEQMRRFIAQSIATGKRWSRIMLEGGEPTLHPQLEEILAELQDYRRLFSPGCEIELCSNGYSARARRLLERLPRGVRVKNSVKSSDRQKGHFGFNIAPIDLDEFRCADYGLGCYIHQIFGLGLTRSGYYPHPVCGGIDRVFGFDIGLKDLPASSADMAGQMRRLCPLCGHFREFRSNGEFPPGHKSPSWIKAYQGFRENRPGLRPF